MKNIFIYCVFLLSFTIKAQTFEVITNKGTLKTIDNSKWTLTGNNIYNKNSGNVGIGILTPAYKLDLQGDFRISGGIIDGSGDIGTTGQLLSSTGTLTDWVSTNTVLWKLLGNSNTDPDNNFIGTTDPQDLVFRTNNIERLRLFNYASPIGVLGLGRNSLSLVNGGASSFSGPTLFFGAAGNISSSTGLDFIIDDDNNATNTQFAFKANGDGNTGTVELMQINEDGRVGIATNSPTAILDVNGAVRLRTLPASATTDNFVTTDTNGNLTKSSTTLNNTFWSLLGNSGTNPTTNFIGTTDAIDFRVRTNNVERLSVTAAGNVGIGTTTPTQFLSLDGSSNRTINVERHPISNRPGNALTLLAGGAATGSSNRAGGNLILSSGISTGIRTSDIFFQTATAGPTGSADNNTTTKMTILGSGNVGIGTTTPATQLHTTGSVRFDNLAGVGTRMVTTDATGNLASATLTNGTVTNVSGTAPISVATGTTTPVISLDNLGVTTLKIADNAVTTSKIADSSITTAKILDDNVTLPKIAQAGATTGQVIKWNGSAWTPAADTDTDTDTTYTGSTSIALNGSSFERAALTGDVTATANSNTTTIANNAVTSSKIIDGTIVNADLNTGVGGIYNGSGTTPTSAVVVSVPTSGTLAFNPSGTQVVNQFSIDGTSFSVDALNNRVGIGTSSPSATLDINGQARVRTLLGSAITDNFVTTDTNGNLTKSSTTLNNTFWSLLGNTGTNPTTNFIGTTDAIDFRVRTNNVERLSVTAAGNVGIGTTTPTQSLEVVGSIYVNADNTAITIDAAGASRLGFVKKSGYSPVIASGSTSALILGAWSAPNIPGNASGTFTERMRISPTGNVGIGIQTSAGTGGVTPTQILSLGGQAPRTINVERNPMLNTAGSNLTILAGGATFSTASDKNGGNLILSSGISTGTGSSDISFQTSMAGVTGTTDNAPTTKMTILGNGNVGIGLNTPTSKLQVQGDLRVTGGVLDSSGDIGALGDVLSSTATGTNWVSLAAATSTEWSRTGNDSTDPSLNFIGNTDAVDLRIRTSNLERISVTAAGNVGIGTISPNAPLQFTNTLANRKIVLSETVNNDHQIYGLGINANALRYQVDATSANHVFYAGTSATTSSELMRIQGNGNVGIGISNPNQTLEVGGNIYLNTEGSAIVNDVNQSRLGLVKKSGLIPVIAAGSSTPILFGNWSTSNLLGNIVSGSFTERMRIDSGGNVAIGNAIVPTAKLDIDGNTIRLRTPKTPLSSSDSCNTGDMAWDSNYVYVCVAPNTWKRSALAGGW